MDRRDYMAMTGGDRSTVADGKLVVLVEDLETGDEIELRLPVQYVVCGTCQGRGSHVNPSIDSHGLTAEDFAEDPDFREDYFSGMYDQTCNECHGLRVTHAVDRECCNADDLELYDTHLENKRAYEQERANQMRYGY